MVLKETPKWLPVKAKFYSLVSPSDTLRLKISFVVEKSLKITIKVIIVWSGCTPNGFL